MSFMSFLYTSAPSAPVQNVSVDNTTSESITVSWEPPADEQQNGIIINYVVQVAAEGETATYLNSTTTYIVITSLKPYTNYEYSIAAETSAGRGPFSSISTTQTDEAGELEEHLCTINTSVSFSFFIQLPVHLHEI